MIVNFTVTCDTLFVIPNLSTGLSAAVCAIASCVISHVMWRKSTISWWRRLAVLATLKGTSRWAHNLWPM